jgi:hypothetical protein
VAGLLPFPRGGAWDDGLLCGLAVPIFCEIVEHDSSLSRVEVAVAVLLAVDFLVGTLFVGLFAVFVASAAAALSFERV